MALEREEWERLVAKWRASGQTARQFAESHGVKDSALRYWGARLADEARQAEMAVGRRAPRASSTPALARVVRVGEPPPETATGRVLIVIGKAFIVVEPGFDGGHLRDVVRALGEAG